MPLNQLAFLYLSNRAMRNRRYPTAVKSSSQSVKRRRSETWTVVNDCPADTRLRNNPMTIRTVGPKAHNKINLVILNIRNLAQIAYDHSPVVTCHPGGQASK